MRDGVAPIMGLVLALIFMTSVFWILRNKPPQRIDAWFRKLQLLSAAAYSLGHGGNDAQKTMGIVASALFSAKIITASELRGGWGHYHWPIILAAHTAIAKSLELDEREIEAARGGGSDNAKADAAVAFARKVAVQRGDVTDADLQHVRDAGYSDAELVEIVARVALSTFTNYVNEVFKTPIDFPVAAPASRAA